MKTNTKCAGQTPGARQLENNHEARIVRQLFPKGAPSRRNSSIAKKLAASYIGAIARGCASCAVTSKTLVDSSGGDPRPGPDETKWCVGITVDTERGRIYWTQKGPTKAGRGRIFRGNIEITKGENATNRSNVEVLFDKLPEPIDLELDLENRVLYWTDRGDPPRGNTVNRASMDAKPGEATPEILVPRLMEGIGIALDYKGNRMFFTDLAGDVYSTKLNGSEKKLLLGVQGNLTGIAYVEIP
jgi:hypothetical protein